MKILLLYRNQEDLLALRSLLKVLDQQHHVAELNFAFTRSVDEYQAANRWGMVTAAVAKITEVLCLAARVLVKDADVLLYCTPHPAFRVVRVWGRSCICVCYLRTQHFLKLAQSLSDRLGLLAGRLGLKTIILDNYFADLSLLPGVINQSYITWRGAPERSCRIVGYFPIPTKFKRGSGRVIIATQNWAGHGFADTAADQTRAVNELYQTLQLLKIDSVIIRPHPRDQSEYDCKDLDQSSEFIHTVGEGDILISDLSSFVGDCWVRGAKVILWALAGAANFNEIVYSAYSVRPCRNAREVAAELASIRKGNSPLAESFCAMTVAKLDLPVIGSRIAESLPIPNMICV